MATRFKLYTIVDITSTSARRGEDPLRYNQQQNYLTILQTIGLRVNPTVYQTPYVTDEKIKFGNRHKNIKKIWCFEFEIEFEDAINVDMLKDDFDFIPFINGLTETAIFKDTVFRTKCTKDTNIVFYQLDK